VTTTVSHGTNNNHEDSDEGELAYRRARCTSPAATLETFGRKTCGGGEASAEG
jgi:hypothetical protein